MITFYEKRSEVLNLRNSYLKINPHSFKGNTQQRKHYVAKLLELTPEVCEFQRDLIIGLVLSDASLQLNKASTTCRLTIQLTNEKKDFLLFVKDCLLEYTANDLGLNQLSNNSRNMCEFQTMSLPQFMEIRNLFFDQKTPKKMINPALQDMLSPISIAFWFCGDGCSLLGSNNASKIISFNTQGFSKLDQEYLVKGLARFGLVGHIKLDSPSKNQFRIDLEGGSYDKFVEVVGPYIHPAYFYKVPAGRKDASRFGYMTEKQRNSILGSALVF